MNIRPNPLPPAQLLRELFSYDSESGELIHKKRRCGTLVGSVAGNLTPHGYRRIKISKKLYLAHRLIYKMMTGVDPGNREVDHIDGNRADSRIENLRLATHGQNQQNGKTYKNNKTGRRGVIWHKQHRKYSVSIQSDGIRRHVGLFRCIDEATRAYDIAAVESFGEYARPNKTENVNG